MREQRQTLSEERFIRGLWRENLRHLPLLLLLSLGLPLSMLLITYWVSGRSFADIYSFEVLMLPVELFFIPWVIINVIFVLQYFFDRRQLREWRSLTLKISGTIAGAFLAGVLIEQVYRYRGITDDDYLVFGDVRLSPEWSNYIEQTVIALIIAIPVFIRQARKRSLLFELKEKEFEVQRLEEMRVKAQLSALQARINPHFLYNALNSVVSLIRKRPVEAERMVTNLADLFRYSLGSGEEGSMSNVREELKIVDTYLAIEKVRFGEKLCVTQNIAAAAESHAIPRFLIQPLVENAIKHGSSKVKKGVIGLEVSVEDGVLHVKVYDNGPDFPDVFPGGYGLQSTYEKLELLFPERHDVTFVNGCNKHIHVTIRED